jgi:hypothetical protein
VILQGFQNLVGIFKKDMAFPTSTRSKKDLAGVAKVSLPGFQNLVNV